MQKMASKNLIILKPPNTTIALLHTPNQIINNLYNMHNMIHHHYSYNLLSNLYNVLLENFFFMPNQAIDNTMLPALNNIATTTVNSTEVTLKATKHLLNYTASNSNTSIKYRVSDMILQTHSNTVYLINPKAHSYAGGYYFLGEDDHIQFNTQILVITCIIKNVIASAAEAEISSLYMNAQEVIPLCICLINLGHPQSITPITIDNITAYDIIQGTMKQKMMKAIDMRFN